MLSRPFDTEALALRHSSQAGTLALAGRETGAEVPKMGCGVPETSGGMGHLQVSPSDRRPDDTPRGASHPAPARRAHARGIDAGAGVVIVLLCTNVSLHNHKKAGELIRVAQARLRLNNPAFKRIANYIITPETIKHRDEVSGVPGTQQARAGDG